MTQPLEDGLRYVELDANGDQVVLDGDSGGAGQPGGNDLETLRDEFVDAFNARDLEAILGLVADDVECPDIGGEGSAAFAAELAAIWDRSPGAIVTRAFLDDAPCAVAWVPNEEGSWSRAGLLALDGEDDLLRLVELVDDPDSMDRVVADDPSGEELDEGMGWSEWDRGEALAPADPDRTRP